MDTKRVESLKENDKQPHSNLRCIFTVKILGRI